MRAVLAALPTPATATFPAVASRQEGPKVEVRGAVEGPDTGTPRRRALGLLMSGSLHQSGSGSDCHGKIYLEPPREVEEAEAGIPASRGVFWMNSRAVIIGRLPAPVIVCKRSPGRRSSRVTTAGSFTPTTPHRLTPT